MAVTAVGWTLTIGVIAALLALDLLVATIRPHRVGYRDFLCSRGHDKLDVVSQNGA